MIQTNCFKTAKFELSLGIWSYSGINISRCDNGMVDIFKEKSLYHKMTYLGLALNYSRKKPQINKYCEYGEDNDC